MDHSECRSSSQPMQPHKMTEKSHLRLVEAKTWNREAQGVLRLIPQHLHTPTPPLFPTSIPEVDHRHFRFAFALQSPSPLCLVFLPGFWLRGPQFVLIGHAKISSYLPVTKESSIWVDRKLEVCEGTLRLRRMKEIQISLPSFPQLRKKNEKTSVYRRWFPLVF